MPASVARACGWRSRVWPHACNTAYPVRRGGCRMNPWLDDASSLADAVRAGRVRSADVTEASLAAIAASKLNAVTYLDADGARRAAAEVDRRAASGEDPGLLAGVPMLVKD